jgi:hypothetical protein
MNESSLPSPSTQSSTLSPLRSLQEIIHNRITQKKREMHPSHNKAYLESLRIEIDRNIAWVLAQILTLLRQSSANT